MTLSAASYSVMPTFRVVFLFHGFRLIVKRCIDLRKLHEIFRILLYSRDVFVLTDFRLLNSRLLRGICLIRQRIRTIAAAHGQHDKCTHQQRIPPHDNTSLLAGEIPRLLSKTQKAKSWSHIHAQKKMLFFNSINSITSLII